MDSSRSAIDDDLGISMPSDDGGRLKASLFVSNKLDKFDEKDEGEFGPGL